MKPARNRSLGRRLYSVCVLVWAGSAFAAPFSGALFEDDPSLAPTELLPAYLDHLGAPIDAGLKRKLTLSVSRAYESRGFLAPAPVVTQTHSNAGIVVLAVNEPHVAKVSVQGMQHVEGTDFLSRVRQLKQIRPLSRGAFEDWLDHVNATGMVVRGSLAREHAGSHRYLASLAVADRRWQAAVRLDNRGPAQLGSEIVQLSLGYDSPVLALGSLRFDVAAATDTDRLLFGRGSGSYRLLERGTSFRWQYSRSKSLLPVNDSTLKVRHQRESAEIGISVPLTRIANLHTDLEFGLQSYDLDQDVVEGQPLRRDRIRSAELEFNLAAAQGTRHLHLLGMDLERGLGGLGRSPQYSGAPAPDLDFLVVRSNYRYRYRANVDWQILLDLHLQATRDRLPSSKRFFVGGGRLGGAFDPATLGGELGLGARLAAERVLQLGVPLTFFTYFDRGYVWSNDDVPPDSAASVGIGLRTTDQGGLAVSLEAAWPVRQPATPSLLHNGSKLYFSLAYRF